MKITIGWTKSDPTTGYSSFMDGYRPGAAQHVETIDVEVGEWTPEQIAESVFIATNHPEPDSRIGLALDVYQAIQATGYRGQGAHYSLSVGDTVTVDGVTVACEGMGWKRVDSEVKV